MATDHTRPTDDTRAFEEQDARHAHEAGRAPTPEEEKAADSVKPDPAAAEHEKEYNEMAAKAKGEGRI